MTIHCYCDQCERDVIVDNGPQAAALSTAKLVAGNAIFSIANFLGWQLSKALHGRYFQDLGVITNFGRIRFYHDGDSMIESCGFMGLGQIFHGLCGECYDFMFEPRVGGTRSTLRP